MVLLIPVALAHLGGGEDKSVDGYSVDFGYDPAPSVAGTITTFELSISEEATGRVIDPSAVWIRITSREGVHFAGTLYPENSGIAFSHTFPRGGTYEVTARFDKDGDTLLKTSFNIDVENSSKYIFKGLVLTAALVALVVLMGEKIWRKRRKTRKR